MSFRINNSKEGKAPPVHPVSPSSPSSPPPQKVAPVPRTIIIFDKKENKFKIINEADKHKYIT